MEVKTLFVNYASFKRALTNDIKEVIINADDYEEVIIKWSKLCWKHNYDYGKSMYSLSVLITCIRDYA